MFEQLMMMTSSQIFEALMKKITDDPFLEYFAYSTPYTNFAVAGTQQLAFTVGNLPFRVYFLTAQITTPATATIQIMQNNNQKNWFDRAIQFSNINGNAGLPLILPAPRIVAINETVTSYITTAGVDNIQLVFHGAKVYGKAQR